MLDQKTVGSLMQSVDNLPKVTQTLTATNEKLGSMILHAERASRQIMQIQSNTSDDTR